jgi:hypothetical protein
VIHAFADENKFLRRELERLQQKDKMMAANYSRLQNKLTQQEVENKKQKEHYTT